MLQLLHVAIVIEPVGVLGEASCLSVAAHCLLDLSLPIPTLCYRLGLSVMDRGGWAELLLLVKVLTFKIGTGGVGWNISTCFFAFIFILFVEDQHF